MTEPVKTMLNVKECADFLNMSQDWVRKMVRLRRLPFHKIGFCIRFDSKEIEEYKKSTKVKRVA